MHSKFIMQNKPHCISCLYIHISGEICTIHLGVDTDDGNDNSNDNSVGAITGGAIGGIFIAFIIFIATMISCFYFYKNKSIY